MTAPSFVDTNILVYAFAQTEDERHAVAQALMENLLDNQAATVSVQVLKEFYSVATRKLATRISHEDASAIIKDLILSCRVLDDTLPQLERAIETIHSKPFSIWDASILAAAEAAGCEQLFTEDLSDGLMVGGVRISNPFKAARK